MDEGDRGDSVTTDEGAAMGDRDCSIALQLIDTRLN